MIYVICLDTAGFEDWRRSVDFEPSNSQCVMLRTAVGDAGMQLGERLVTETDQVVRWGDYEQGLFWHDVEDAVVEHSPGRC